MGNFFSNQVIFITGAAGSVGQELVRQLLTYGPTEIRALDNNESEIFLMNEHYRSQNNFNAYLGDIRDSAKISAVTRGTDIIFHCAAFKHVHFSEYNPFEAVQTNIIGVQNIVHAALDNQVKRVIFTSSDKAVNPTNVMGTSKLMGERLITAANVINTNKDQRFSSVRFGNVIGSRGSVFHIFKEQIKNGGPVTVTDRQMTRFIMSLERAARLVLDSAILARGGEVMVIKMKVISIIDLAKVMIELMAPQVGRDPAAITIKIIGAKPGEKMYEELISLEEVGRSEELQDTFVIFPAFREFYQKIDSSYPGNIRRKVTRPYISSQEPRMDKEEIRTFLIENKLHLIEGA